MIPRMAKLRGKRSRAARVMVKPGDTVSVTFGRQEGEGDTEAPPEAPAPPEGSLPPAKTSGK